jgi:hypothetical protein
LYQTGRISGANFLDGRDLSERLRRPELSARC